MTIDSAAPSPQTSMSGFASAAHDFASRAKLVAALALLSATVSAFALGSDLLFAVYIPGIAFGGVLAFAVFQIGVRDKFHLAFLILVTAGVWYLANVAGQQFYSVLDQAIRTPKTDDPGQDVWIVLHRDGIVWTGAYLAGGFVGGLGVFLLVAFVAKPLRNALTCLILSMVGAVAGAVGASLPAPSFLNAFSMFLFWQETIALALVWRLAGPQPASDARL